MALQDFTLNLKANTLALEKSIKSVTEKPYTVNLKLDGASTKTFVQDIKSADGGLQDVNKAMAQVNAQGSNLNATLSNTGKSVKAIGQDFVVTAGKVAKFGAITAIIGAFTGTVAEAGKTVKQFDDTLVEFRKVSDLSGDSLTQYTQKLAEMGEVTGSTMTSMVSAATEFKKSGFSDDDSATLASVAEIKR